MEAAASASEPVVRHRTERKRSAVRRANRGVSRRVAANPGIRWSVARVGDGLVPSFAFLPREISRPPQRRTASGSRRGDEMAKGREKSDGRIRPQGCRKAAPTARHERGGKATTASERTDQLELFRGTADSPQGADGAREPGQPAPRRRTVPKPRTTTGREPSAMTMEEVASDENLMRAFERVASNDGAPGPDRQSVDEVREHLDDTLPALHSALLNGSYRPGMVRRVWIPKPVGGQRGLGIPNVVDRIVQQAVHQVLSPHYEPTFHDGSHGFRAGRSCHTAIAAARQHVQDGYRWVVDIDLEKFLDPSSYYTPSVEQPAEEASNSVQSLHFQACSTFMANVDGVKRASLYTMQDRGTKPPPDAWRREHRHVVLGHALDGVCA